ncbi:sugar ABC transporter permease [Vulcanisaeta distributa]|uniref:Binding-protein-dependent transport systems inner membrane component n=1 Tax=Vulcanisaeta distributa (strain DSM 14429 / JCM 11212 / NBRC 100878 / IC-017) TaxID=572478 RepID=E1QP04_VULDI|nr:ABC transporter permease subunit [Vulcanisaeta distributa]ADN51369.1 binding-protein-dependent transport systems inner membrane component [Vulcanisaeta distributa DSM 14429]
MSNRYSLRNKVINWVRLGISYIILTVTAIIAVFPIYYIIITSVNPIPTLASITLRSLLPENPSLEAYYYILFKEPFLLWLRNSLILAAGTIAITVIVAFITGAALSRFNVPGKTTLMVTIYVMTFFPFAATALPLYLMFASLGMLRGWATYVGLILAYSGGTSIFSSYLVKVFLDRIPKDYEEAALIDGLTRPGAFFRILLPMAKPIIAFVALLAFMGAYTDYALAYAFIAKGSMWTLTLGMYYLAFVNRATLYNVLAAFSVLMGIPIFAIFMAFQKYLVQIYAMGGVKA